MTLKQIFQLKSIPCVYLHDILKWLWAKACFDASFMCLFGFVAFRVTLNDLCCWTQRCGLLSCIQLWLTDQSWQTGGSFCAFRTNTKIRRSANSADYLWLGIPCYACETRIFDNRQEHSAFVKNVRRSTRMFGFRQECSAFRKSIEYALTSIYYDVLVRIFLFEFS